MQSLFFLLSNWIHLYCLYLIHLDTLHIYKIHTVHVRPTSCFLFLPDTFGVKPLARLTLKSCISINTVTILIALQNNLDFFAQTMQKQCV